jgi:hypothetical protein
MSLQPTKAITPPEKLLYGTIEQDDERENQ